MRLKGLIVSALTLTACAVIVPSLAHADTVVWANWTAGVAGSPGSAAGNIGGIAVTYSGQTDGLTTVPTWTPASSFSGGTVGNAPPPTASIMIEGGMPTLETITFSSTIIDPVFAIWSLGAANTPASFDFESKTSEPFTFIAGGPSTEFGGGPITVNGQIVNGAEGNGVIQFTGAYSSITFTTPDPEFYYAFTVGNDTTLNPPDVPEPGTLSLFGLGILALPLVRTKLSRRRS
jgi:PEP-CTERM motif